MTTKILASLAAMLFAVLTVTERGNGSILYLIYPLGTAFCLISLLVQAQAKEPQEPQSSPDDNTQNA